MKQLCRVIAALALVSGTLARAAEPPELYLSDLVGSGRLTSHQAWGTLGRDTATVPPDGRAASQLRVGERRFDRGLGHHASGEIRVDLRPHDLRLRTTVGVHWQGGDRGSVVAEVWVDDQRLFASPVRSDSDPPIDIDVPVAGGRVLRLVASDAGDGIACDMVEWCRARLLQDPSVPRLGDARLETGGAPVRLSAPWCGVSLAGDGDGPQALVVLPQSSWLAAVEPGESMALCIPITSSSPVRLTVEADAAGSAGAAVGLACAGRTAEARLAPGETRELVLDLAEAPGDSEVRMSARGTEADGCVRWGGARIATADGVEWPLPLPGGTRAGGEPVAVTPVLRPAVGRWLLEWDWRMADGIGAEREPAGCRLAATRVLDSGRCLLEHHGRLGRNVDAWQSRAASLAERLAAAEGSAPAAGQAQRALWRDVHQWRRAMMLDLLWPEGTPIAFVKQAPGISSHQLTQYYGARSRPGGGVFVLEEPGRSWAVRPLTTDALPSGNPQHLEVSPDGQRLLFAFCAGDTVPAHKTQHLDRVYQIYEMRTDGTGLTQLTDGPFDHFAPRYLPNGQIVCVSTRRGGYHRCGAGPCPVYTLTLLDPGGGDPQVISFHETHEWDPCVMQDGRIAYTRWDYVDRSAVYYQQLWTARPDGSDVRILYGNNTFNPVGIWEARRIPASRKLMATAAAHHAMTAGSIILVDPAVDVDGAAPLTRLTPDALFPESEVPVAPRGWHATASVNRREDAPEAARRWPGHCYRSPFPLSETAFIAAYSYDALIGEGGQNPPNMFGLYLCDAFGNRELLYRDPRICSLWPAALRPRPMPPVLPSVLDSEGEEDTTGTFVLADVYASAPRLPDVRIDRLRIVQVLPKTTPHANNPRVGLAHASPGKQVLGTVPVEVDGSACFTAPARLPLLFQALDREGRAVQTMRSVVYLQPGETAGCVGCHESRMEAPGVVKKTLAMRRPPSVIRPGPAGSKPLSYPLLVQPVLDGHCIRCHGDQEPKGGVTLTGTPQGIFTRSYHEMAKRVPYSQWQGGDFRQANGEPLTQPGRFGAVASPLMTKLLRGHKGVRLNDDDISRLVTWMDANALFYGTFNPADQKRQLAGEVIAGPDLE